MVNPVSRQFILGKGDFRVGSRDILLPAASALPVRGRMSIPLLAADDLETPADYPAPHAAGVARLKEVSLTKSA